MTTIDHNACVKTKAMPVNEIPPTPLYKKGGFKWDFSHANNYLPPFLKGDRGLPAIALAQARRAGGFYCAVILPKTTAAYSLYTQS